MSVAFDFVRSHGLGNDYLVMDPARLGFELTPDRVRLICHRNLGVGSDGILLLVPVGAISNREGGGKQIPVAPESRSCKEGQADFAVRILNPDGSEAEKSGNGLRIFAKFLYDHGYTKKTKFTMHTLGGVVNARLILEGGRVVAVRVDMGRAVIDRKLTRLEVGEQTLTIISLSVGNPHCVMIMDDLSKADLIRLGPLIENHRAFPNRTNVQFAQVLDRANVRALIWERGAGHTLASGSSSCAVATACYDKGLVDGHVTVHMEGGSLTIEIDKMLNLVMTGPVEEVCVGTFSRDFRRRLTSAVD
jgi:diaminopimelate epimerase